jgi:hypothetical protein
MFLVDFCDPGSIKFMAEVNNKEGEMGIYFILQRQFWISVMCHFLHEEVSGYNP